MVCVVRLFADDTSLLSIVYDEQVSSGILNADLKFIEKWAYLCKMQFNPDKNKQAIQVLSSHRKSKPIRPPLIFNGCEVECKHLGFFFDSRLSFLRHIKEIIMKARRGVGIIRFMSKYVSPDVLDQMYKLYVRPRLDYGDLTCHKDDPEASLSLTKRLESFQYTTALAVTGARKGTDKSKLLDELGWEYLHDKRRYRRLTHFSNYSKEMHLNT